MYQRLLIRFRYLIVILEGISIAVIKIVVTQVDDSQPIYGTYLPSLIRDKLQALYNLIPKIKSKLQ